MYSLEEQVKKESAAEKALRERLSELGTDHEMEALKVRNCLIIDLVIADRTASFKGGANCTPRSSTGNRAIT